MTDPDGAIHPPSWPRWKPLRAWACPLLLLLALSGCAQPLSEPFAAQQRQAPPSLVQLGDGLQQSGDPEGALALYRAAVGQDGRDPVALARMGRVLMVLGDPARAEQAFGAALTLDNQFTEARFGRALTVLSQRRVDEAVPMLAALASEHSDPATLRAYGAALDMAGRQDEAQAAYRRGLGLAPSDANLHGNLALSLAAAGQMEAALNEARMAEGAPLPDQRQTVNGILLLAVAGHGKEARQRGAALLGPAQTEAVLRQARRVRSAANPLERAMAFGLFKAPRMTAEPEPVERGHVEVGPIMD